MKKLIAIFGLLIVSLTGFSQANYPLTLSEVQAIWAPRYMPSVKDLDSTWSAFWNKSTDGIPQLASQNLITTANFSVTANQTPIVITGLTSNTLTIGATYLFQAALFINSTYSVGIAFNVNGSATATSVQYELYTIDNVTSAFVITNYKTALNSSSTYSNAITGVFTSFCFIQGTITISTAGNLSLYFSQAASNSKYVSIARGSTFIIQKL